MMLERSASVPLRPALAPGLLPPPLAAPAPQLGAEAHPLLGVRPYVVALPQITHIAAPARARSRPKRSPRSWEPSTRPAEWARRAHAVEAQLAARSVLRKEMGLQHIPNVIFNLEHPMLAIPASRARLQFCESPRRARGLAVELVSVEEAVMMVKEAFPRKRRQVVPPPPPRRFDTKGRPPNDPLSLPAVPAERKQRLPRLTLKRTLPKMSAAQSSPNLRLRPSAFEPPSAAAVMSGGFGLGASRRGIHVLLLTE
jgi:hypothetical protein